MKRISGIALASLAALAVFSCTKSPGPAAVEKITVTPDKERLLQANIRSEMKNHSTKL